MADIFIGYARRDRETIEKLAAAIEAAGIDPNTMSIIVTKGSLDWAYPPFILSTTAAAHFGDLLAIATPGPFFFLGDVP